MQDKLIIGFVRSSHGVRGTVKVESTSGEFEHFLNLNEVFLVKANETKQYYIEQVSKAAAFLLIKFKGIDTRESAQLLSGSSILVDRMSACPLKKNEFYIEDLKSCSLIYDTDIGKGKSQNSFCVGHITDVIEGGGTNLLEVSLADSENVVSNHTDKKKGESVRFVPFNKEFIGMVDVENGVVQLKHLWILE